MPKTHGGDAQETKSKQGQTLTPTLFAAPTLSVKTCHQNLVKAQKERVECEKRIVRVLKQLKPGPGATQEELQCMRKLVELITRERVAEEQYKIASCQQDIVRRMMDMREDVVRMGTYLNGEIFSATWKEVQQIYHTFQALQKELYSKGAKMKEREMREKEENMRVRRNQKVKEEKKKERQDHSGMSQEEVVEAMQKILRMMASPDGALLSSDQMCSIYNKYFQKSMGQGDFRKALQAVARKTGTGRSWALKGDRLPFSADVLKVALQLHKGRKPHSFSKTELVQIHKHLLSNSGMSGEDFGTLCMKPMFTWYGTNMGERWFYLNMSSSDSGSDSSSDSGSDSSSDSGSDSAALKKKLPVKKRPVKQGVKRPLETSEAPDPKKAC